MILVGKSVNESHPDYCDSAAARRPEEYIIRYLNKKVIPNLDYQMNKKRNPKEVTIDDIKWYLDNSNKTRPRANFSFLDRDFALDYLKKRYNLDK